MRVIVTGAAGFIGSHIVDELISRGHDVFILDNLSSGRESNINPKAHFSSPLDVTSESDVNYLVNAIHPAVICHQAAQPSLLTSVNNPQLDAEINIIGTINVIEAARKVGAHVTLASTSAVYDADAPQPYREDAPKRATRPYGIAKLAAENYLRESGVSYSILRYGNVYGPRQVIVGDNQLVPHVLDHIYHGAKFVVNGDGNQARDFIYVEEVARANRLVIEGRKVGTFNIAHGIPKSINEVLLLLKSLTGYSSEFKHGPAKPKEPRSVTLDTHWALSELGWSSLVPLVEGLGRTVKWYEAQRQTA